MKRIISLLLVMVMVVSLVPAVHAETLKGSCGDYAKWELNLDTGHLRVYGEGDMTTRPWSDNKWKIRTITIEPGITSICSKAFYECWYLESITVADSVRTIGASAFERASMKYFDFPDQLEVIGSDAFRNCTNLQAAYLPAGLTTLEGYAFRYCSGLKEVTFPEGLVKIGDWCFEDCDGLQQVVIPDTVTYLGTGAFKSCGNLTAAKLSTSLTEIRERTFQDCAKLATVNIPEGVTSIGMCAFSSCSSLKRIKLPVTLTTIGDIAFGWSGLEQIIIPESVTKIATGSVGNDVFSDCPNLERIAILNPDCNLITSSLGIVGKATVYCYKESTAHRYAVNKGYNFEFLEDTELWEEFYNPFQDVTEDQYYFKPILWAYETGVTAGSTAFSFEPESSCQRGQVVTFLHRSMDKPEHTVSESPFTDVPAGEYFYDPVMWAVENKITVGTGAGKFSPAETVTRGQFVTFLWRTMGEPDASGASGFADVPASEYYAEAVAWAVENGITQGTGAGKFSPDAHCTRAQVVTFLYRLLG